VSRTSFIVIFKPFVQAGKHRDKEKMGSGLGLAIVNHLTQLMGGTVTVASVIGQGSAFHLRFPDVEVSARLPTLERRGSESAADFNELRPAKILVVDDNEINCRLVGGMFEDSHHHLEYGADGRDALEKTRTLRPDVVLLDIRMPNMDGYEAADEIRKMPGLALLPIIAVTASTLIDDEKNLGGRFNGFLRKPFTRRELLDQLGQFIPRTRQNSAGAGAPFSVSVNGSLPRTPEWRGLAMQLRSLEGLEWPGVRDGLAVNETHAFARKLEALAREIPCEPLQAYSEMLVHHADNYAVDALEKHLQEFPALIERIERSSV
jgi:CheY-like chemotaxis protein